VPSAAGRPIAADSLGLRPHLVIYDERFEAAQRFAVSVRSIPAPVHPIRGDVTQLWYSQLQPLWKRAPVAIAGLTTYAVMFCLEQLARDQQLRMIRYDAGKAAHGSAGWPIERAAVIARGFRASPVSGTRRRTAADALAAATDTGPLHFWLIAQPHSLQPSPPDQTGVPGCERRKV
jgi:hypothetical protein